jgi:hypothetical protein
MLIILLLASLLTPYGAFAKEIHSLPFWWDVENTEITTVSSGTGGTPQNAPINRYLRDYLYFDDYEMETYYFDTLGMLEVWRKGEALGWEPTEHAEMWIDKRIIQYVVWSEEVTSHSYSDELIPSAWRVHAATFDANTLEKLSLSDLFYDGVNYIRYINEQAALALLSSPSIGIDYTAVVESMLRRPFSGFPRDYPYFRIVEGMYGGRMLELLINHENPLFSVGLTEFYPSIQVPLLDTISPYGAPWANTTIILANEKYNVAHITLPEGKDPSTTKKINAGFEAAAQKALAHPMIPMRDNPNSPLVPRVHIAETYLSVLYYGDDGYKDFDQSVITAAAFDMETGEQVNGEAIWQTVASLIAKEGISEDHYDWDTSPSLMAYEIQDDFGIRYTPDAPNRQPPISEMWYVGCRAWVSHDKGKDRVIFCAMYFDPNRNVHHEVQISKELLQKHGAMP